MQERQSFERELSVLAGDLGEIPRELFEHQTSGAGGVPAWAAGIEPFPSAPLVSFNTSDPRMVSAFSPIRTGGVSHLCASLVDLTGNPATPPYAGLNDNEMVFAGSMVKVVAVYTAFALRAQVQAFVDAALANGAPVVPPGITRSIGKVWKQKLRDMFPTRPTRSFGNKQDITFPRLDRIFTFSPAGRVDFARAAPTMTDADLDQTGEFGAPKGGFHDWMSLMCRWSNNIAASRCILALGYFYLNGLLAQTGFFDSSTNNGLWLSADWKAHDWVTIPADKRRNAAGQPLTPRWARAQGRRRSNITATAYQTARLMTLLAQGKLVPADAHHANPGAEMRNLLQSAVRCVPGGKCGIGSYVEDALGAPRLTPPPFTVLATKIGYGDDKFSHDCAIVERIVAGKPLHYVVVGLGSAPSQGRQDLSGLFRQLDQVIVGLHP